MNKKILLALGLAGTTFLAACGNVNGGNGDTEEPTTEENGNGEEETAAADFTVGMVTDLGGIDDKSFNQSTWEGLQLFAEENGLVVGEDLRFLASQAEVDYIPHLTTFAEQGFDLTFGVGFLLDESVATVAAQFPDQKFAIIDAVVDKPNVASITFEDHVGSFLAGVAAAMTTETDTVGFVGGVESEVIERFEVGFVQGVKAVNPDIEVLIAYAGAFNQPAQGQALATTMFDQGADVIFHASGGTGNGVFTEARNRRADGDNVWVIGVDRDQHDQGMPENVTLTSMLKRVDVAAKYFATKALNGEFPGGETVVYGLAEGGVGVAEGNLSEEILAEVDAFSEKILNGDITVFPTRAEMEANK